ncbi:MAG: 2-amino-4-hydroxy-6-hydroxymethyldihydropteridine diphosphokinase [Prochloraceae cyanobacterium]|nr:2-amino-4-hydroxy-6-hydroxymethyldihydropteridine diphosphokinase [Prochloraceae cyanobacterium]
MVSCAIALGSNLGDSLNILEDSLQRLTADRNISLTSLSNWYRTRPIGPPQPDYFNGCAILEVKSLTPHQLLATLLGVENQFGRVRDRFWGPRTLDLDLLLYGDLILNSPSLEIPHPRMRERAFVLVPLASIAPDWIEPVTKLSIAQLLERVDISGVRLI